MATKKRKPVKAKVSRSVMTFKSAGRTIRIPVTTTTREIKAPITIKKGGL